MNQQQTNRTDITNKHHTFLCCVAWVSVGRFGYECIDCRFKTSKQESKEVEKHAQIIGSGWLDNALGWLRCETEKQVATERTDGGRNKHAAAVAGGRWHIAIPMGLTYTTL